MQLLIYYESSHKASTSQLTTFCACVYFNPILSWFLNDGVNIEAMQRP
jgi:hypothetical protein